MTVCENHHKPLSWHQPQWAMIEKSLKEGTLPPALLLKGEEGLGQAVFARQLANRLLCTSAVSMQACQSCDACQLFAVGHHPDYFQLIPPEKSRAIGIDDVRALSEKLQQSTHHGRYQVVVIDPITALTNGAANALLKTLEEPMGDVIILGVMSEQYNLLPTLLSRMVLLPFYKGAYMNDATLISNLNKAGEHQKLMTMLWGHAPLQCEKAIDQEAWLLGMAVLDHCGKSMVPRHDALHNTTFWSKQAALDVLQWIYCIIADAVRLSVGMPLSCCAFENAPKKIEYIAKNISLDCWFALLKEAEKAIADIQSSTAFNGQYHIEKMFILLQNKALNNIA